MDRFCFYLRLFDSVHCYQKRVITYTMILVTKYNSYVDIDKLQMIFFSHFLLDKSISTVFADLKKQHENMYMVAKAPTVI